MVKTLMMSAAVSALMVTGAMAQSTQPAPAPAAPAAKDAAPDSAKFVQQQSSDHFVFSKFKGTDVIGPDNAKVGDVNDMVFDKNGKLIGLVVGVGGFLGIGEKNVAMDMSAFQVVPASTGSSTTGTSTAPRANNDPTDIKLKVSWTKDQLKNAPDFNYYQAASTSSPTTGTAPRTGSPPRQ
jgi:sporulation protein YlmC with PRC-barrel domain